MVRYINTSKSEAAHFINPDDRAYFSKPVEVFVLGMYKDYGDMAIVCDPVRGHTYPCLTKHLDRYPAAKQPK